MRFLIATAACLSASLACTPPVRAAQECRFSIEQRVAGQLRTVTRTLSVGEIDRGLRPALFRLVNIGAHDIRVTFDGAPPRQLRRGEFEPAEGRFSSDVVLRSVECLPARSLGD